MRKKTERCRNWFHPELASPLLHQTLTEHRQLFHGNTPLLWMIKQGKHRQLHREVHSAICVHYLYKRPSLPIVQKMVQHKSWQPMGQHCCRVKRSFMASFN